MVYESTFFHMFVFFPAGFTKDWFLLEHMYLIPSFDVRYLRKRHCLVKIRVANIMLTNVAYGIAPFREKPTVMEATNKRMNVVVSFYLKFQRE